MLDRETHAARIAPELPRFFSGMLVIFEDIVDQDSVSANKTFDLVSETAQNGCDGCFHRNIEFAWRTLTCR
jgi:hypothetical protein